MIRCLLFDTDNWAQSTDFVHIRSLQITKEITRITRERLDIAPLTFGIDCVEGQR